MTGYSFFSSLSALLLFLAHLAVIVRVILRPHREPASRIAWIVIIIVLPVAGMISYLLLGETNIGRHRARRLQDVLAGMPRIGDAPRGIRGQHARISLFFAIFPDTIDCEDEREVLKLTPIT